MAVDSILWTYQDSTSISTRELIHENCKIIQEFHGYNSVKTLTITALSFTRLKRILLSQPSRTIKCVIPLFSHMMAARVYYTADLQETHKEVGVGEA